MTEQEQKAIKWMQNVSPMFYAGRKEKAETIINGFEELEQYRAMEKRLEAIYGDCPGLLETVVEHLERHDGIGTDKPAFKARLLTDDNVDKWDSYKEIGTPEECRAAVEKQKEYDVEKVIEQIKSLSKSNYVDRNKVIEIVRGGGIE